MDDFPLGLVLTLAGVAVSLLAFCWEFLFIRRKRIGYRVQLDTRIQADDNGQTEVNPGALRQLDFGDHGTRLIDPTLVLLRLENAGSTNIDLDDYAAREGADVGLQVQFPGRRVVDKAITETSDPHLDQFFGADSGLGHHGDTIRLPRVPLNRKAHYKVLAVLERDGPNPGREYPEPVLIGAIKGGVRSGRPVKTSSQTGASAWTWLLVASLAVALVAFGLDTWLLPPDPLGCTSGNLVITGSTAFENILQESMDGYTSTCSHAEVVRDTRNSADGILNLNKIAESGLPDKTKDYIVFSDGTTSSGSDRIKGRPVALVSFSIVVNPEATVPDLSLQNIKDLFSGKIKNWTELGGANLPVRLVGRTGGSGSRKAFEQALDGDEGVMNSENCRDLNHSLPSDPNRVRLCERSTTELLLDAVATTPGAIGYSETNKARGHTGVHTILISSGRSSLNNVSKDGFFWATEYAYTIGEPPVGSPVAGFLNYLTESVGKQAIRVGGAKPCADLTRATECVPD
ncbi:substrate-binding domain-containing protein [Actinokineospora inagensis]|uniref:substrate-binding domain-containing protein n=1 Tax=Actinokineospora inagensis TaxID=103730 RepID=UPI0004024A83|nr:substrate-binding domain-containing protein [Actinokineospora inagensis]